MTPATQAINALLVHEAAYESNGWIDEERHQARMKAYNRALTDVQIAEAREARRHG